MKIIVLGAGAMGSLYGAKLSKLNDVLLVGNQQHINKISKDGLSIIGLENKTYNIKASTKIKKIQDNTLILLTTKVYDNERAINSIKNLLKKDTIILCLQNGLYSEDIIKKIVKDKCLVLRAITNFGAAFLKPGVVQYNSYSYTIIEKSKKSKKIAENFKKCGLNGYVSYNIKVDMWKKVIFNCVLNPISAILRVQNKEIASDKLNSFKKIIVDECLKVAKKDGVRFNIDFVKTINEEFKNSINISSMRQDLIKGKKTEIDYLNGAVVKLGKKYSIKCPMNEALTMIIKGVKSVK